MRSRVLDPRTVPLDQAFGAILAADVRGGDGHDVLRKGTRLGERHRAALGAIGTPLHLVDLDADELEQDAVATRLATAIAGPGTQVDAPSQGQVRVVAARRGRVRVNADAVARMNALHPVLVFTAADGVVVAERADVAGAKSAVLATPEALVVAAERIAEASPVVAVAAFAPRRIAVVVTDRLEPRGRALVHQAIAKKVRWFGSTLASFAEVAHDEAAIAQALGAAVDGGAELVLLSGASPLDPLDPALAALARRGGRIERGGVPAHPGSMVWVGALPAVPVLGIASCAGFGKDTALDLLLARVLSGDAPEAAADALGAGGLAEGASPGSPFPRYDAT